MIRTYLSNAAFGEAESDTGAAEIKYHREYINFTIELASDSCTDRFLLINFQIYL